MAKDNTYKKENAFWSSQNGCPETKTQCLV